MKRIIRNYQYATLLRNYGIVFSNAIFLIVKSFSTVIVRNHGKSVNPPSTAQSSFSWGKTVDLERGTGLLQIIVRFTLVCYLLLCNHDYLYCVTV